MKGQKMNVGQGIIVMCLGAMGGRGLIKLKLGAKKEDIKKRTEKKWERGETMVRR